MTTTATSATSRGSWFAFALPAGRNNHDPSPSLKPVGRRSIRSRSACSAPEQAGSNQTCRGSHEDCRRPFIRSRLAITRSDCRDQVSNTEHSQGVGMKFLQNTKIYRWMKRHFFNQAIELLAANNDTITARKILRGAEMKARQS